MVDLPKSDPASSRGVLERAERRLVGSIKHDEPRAKQVANAERVRRAQLGCLKARALATSIPTDVDDEEWNRRQANLSDARQTWENLSVDEIIEKYSNKATDVARRSMSM